MKTRANSQRPTQPAAEALAIWERAAKENKPIGLDNRGNVTMLFGASHDSFSGTASHRQAAKDSILSKMRSEMAERGTWNGGVIFNVMSSKLPSLHGFMKDDQVGHLRGEWEALRKTSEASLNLPPDVLSYRIAVAERIEPFLPPGLGVSLHDDGTSWLKPIFSDQQQQQILDGLASLAGNAADPVLHVNPQMLKDLDRDTYDIILPNGMSVVDETTEHQ